MLRHVRQLQNVQDAPLPGLTHLTHATTEVADNAALAPRRMGGTASQPIRTPTTTPVSYMTVYAPQ
jgi:hypothetical protein